MAVPDLDGVFLHVLTIVEPLHGERAIEGYRLGEIDLERGMMRALRRGPEGVRIAVERSSDFWCGSSVSSARLWL